MSEIQISNTSDEVRDAIRTLLRHAQIPQEALESGVRASAGGDSVTITE